MISFSFPSLSIHVAVVYVYACVHVCAYVPVEGNKNSDKQSILAKLQFSHYPLPILSIMLYYYNNRGKACILSAHATKIVNNDMPKIQIYPLLGVLRLIMQIKAH